MCAVLSEARDAIEEVIEPFLMQAGLVARTPRGRVLTQGAWRHLGLTPPRGRDQEDLFDEGGK
jgi:Holliday junction DNA helicase RuvB